MYSRLEMEKMRTKMRNLKDVRTARTLAVVQTFELWHPQDMDVMAVRSRLSLLSIKHN